MLRLLTPTDTQAYLKLRLLGLQTDPKTFLSTFEREKDWPSTFFTNKIIYATKPPIFGVYGKFSEDQLIATAQLAAEYHPKNQHIANIYDVYVQPTQRRNSVGSQILKHLISKAKTHLALEQLHLRVNSDNIPAISLYKKLGFTRIATRKNAVKEADGTYQDEHFFCLSIK